MTCCMEKYFYSTYKELKRRTIAGSSSADRNFYSTYKELKLIFAGVVSPVESEFLQYL